MKAICVKHAYSEIQGLQIPEIRLFADSAILRDVMPLFVPDVPVQWSALVCLAVRIGRLGKHISPKFATRYIDAIGLVNVLSPDADSPQGATLDSTGIMSIIDGAVTTGTWIPADLNLTREISWEVNQCKYTHNMQDLDIPEVIHQVSLLSTLKTGDIIIILDTAAAMPLEADQHICGSIQGQECLHIKVKI